jgi:hypothetical protein
MGELGNTNSPINITSYTVKEVRRHIAKEMLKNLDGETVVQPESKITPSESKGSKIISITHKGSLVVYKVKNLDTGKIIGIEANKNSIMYHKLIKEINEE